jgi:PPOX class probable F420-dependent enzyme
MDLNTKFGRRVKRRLKSEQEIWLTTVDKTGTPQPRPVWFYWDGETFVIYSQPRAHKVKHIARNPNVVLHLNSTTEDGGVVVFHGRAEEDRAAPAPIKHRAYFRKYKQGIRDINMTPQQFAEEYSVAIRVTPKTLRGW